MSNTEKERINALANRQGIFGFGFSNNNHLDLLNLIVLACSGIIITLFFGSASAYDEKFGTNGQASSNIWGYGITCVALFLMLFMSFYLKNRENSLKNKKVLEYENSDNEDSLLSILTSYILNDSLPILMTFGLLVYAIILNYTYFEKINKKHISPTYFTYEFYFSLLIIIQIGIIVKYMYSLLRKNDGSSTSHDNKQMTLLKSISCILSTINLIFLMILHIFLVFFSTDG